MITPQGKTGKSAESHSNFGRVIKKEKIGLLALLYFCYVFYFIQDMQTSASTNVKQTGSRLGVYVFLGAIITILTLYFALNAAQKKPNAICMCMYALAAWALIVDIFRGVSFWQLAVHIGLLVMLAGIVYFVGAYIDSLYKLKWLIRFELIIWLICVYFSLIAIVNFRDFWGDGGIIVLNMAYVVMAFFPLLFCGSQNKVLRFCVFVFSCAYTIASLKRGAIIALVMVLVVWFFYTNITVKTIDGKKNYFINKNSFLILMAMAVFVFVLLQNETISSGLFERFSKESLSYGSNRDRIYSEAITNIMNSSFLDILFGKGSGSPLRELGTGIHNDFLEIQYSYGLVGTSLYIAIVVLMFVNIFKKWKAYGKYSVMFAISALYIVLVGLYSASFFTQTAFHIFAAMSVSPALLVESGKERK